LEQQADIQTRISLLLAAQNGFDPSHELRMLLHKCRVLENFVHDNGLTSLVPFVSDIEEARALQSRCESLELACSQDRKNQLAQMPPGP
jgi:hypothetical protein